MVQAHGLNPELDRLFEKGVSEAPLSQAFWYAIITAQGPFVFHLPQFMQVRQYSRYL